MNPRVAFLCAFTFVSGVLLSQLWQSLKTTYFWHPVQHLRSPDRQHRAVLERVDGLYLNFRLLVNNQVVYWSPDFHPSPSRPLRETLLWDDTGQVLILEILEQ